jgi:2-dehydro-3-deoxygalactonokinase
LANEDRPLVCVDMGTTRTRTWVLQGENVLSCEEAEFGARDSGREDQNTLEHRVSSLVETAIENASRSGLTERPEFVVGAGMITSRQGLREVPHLLGPAGLSELASGLTILRLPEFNDLQLALIPGVRTVNPRSADLGKTLLADLIRGEETLCIGLTREGRLLPTDVLITLGSHWKWIWMDEALRIARSYTTLTGELIHVAQTNTLLASALPKGRPQHLDPCWMQAGSEEARKSGLTRALFCVRLLEQMSDGSPDERLSFLYGIFLESEMDTIQRSRLCDSSKRLLVSGHPSLARAFAERLRACDMKVEVLPEQEREKAFLRGLLTVFRQSMYGYP